LAHAALSREEIERGYDNRGAVPEHPEWFARWAALSDDARARLKYASDLRCGPNPKETLDLYTPAGTSRGTFAFIHGGYWRALDKQDHAFVAMPFVQHGYAVAVLNYDLCPAVSIATIVDECRRAIAWLVREGARHGANTGTLVVGGHSAGGHLAAMSLAARAQTFGVQRHPVAAAVSLSGLHDLRPLTQVSFNADLKLDDAEAARLSPALQPPGTDAPLMIAVGADETPEFLRQSQLMVDAWPANRPAGMRQPLVLDRRHHFSVVADYADEASELAQRTLALFDAGR
jgi:arylformamidase